MKFTIITHVQHLKKGNQYFGYGPYIREMNNWLKYVDDVIIVAPLTNHSISEIDLPYLNKSIHFSKVHNFDLKSFKSCVNALLVIPKIVWQVFKAMQSANHIHLRCPGNMGLIGCFVQILFPFKQKSAKYAGNCYPKSKQPWSYRLQKWILSNTFLTRNMQVLVYGEWVNQTKNIKPFFTASYYKSEIKPLQKIDEQTIRFVFAGSLVSGKNPIYALELINQLKSVLPSIQLDLYGDGLLREELQQQIIKNNLEKEVFLHGNQNAEVLKLAFQNSHFVILPSKSEGWPKVLAEGMFWGCVPIATPVSCVPNMLDYGYRGIILELNLEKDVAAIKNLILNKNRFETMRQSGANWSRNYTLDYFESEISKILRS